MLKRRNLLILLVAVLGIACWLTGAPAAKAGAEDCCVDLQGQACAPIQSPTDCNWGAYGPGYCQCYARKWECYSYVSIPNPPDQPICY